MASVTKTYQITTGINDGIAISGAILENNSTFLDVGYEYANENGIYLLFNNINIPSGTIISSSKLILNKRSNGGGIVNTIVNVSDEANPTTITNISDYKTRSRYGSIPLQWDYVESPNTPFEIINLGGLVQYVINKPGRDSNSGILFFLNYDKNLTSPLSKDSFTSYEGDPTKAAKLEITYEEPSVNSMNGSGTELDPYQITTLAQLDEVRNDLTACYKLMNDIDASDTINWNGGKGFLPIYTLFQETTIQEVFVGILDGDFHKVTNLYTASLFPYTINSVIKNIAFIDFTSSGEPVPGIVGVSALNPFILLMESDLFENVIVKGTILGKVIKPTDMPVPIYAYSSQINNCIIDLDIRYENTLVNLAPLVFVSEDVNQKGTKTKNVCNISKNNVFGIGVNKCLAFSSSDTSNFESVYFNVDLITDTEFTTGDTFTNTLEYARTTSQMKEQTTYVGWDFDTVWGIDPNINEGYPYLRGFEYEVVDTTPPLSPITNYSDVSPWKGMRRCILNPDGSRVGYLDGNDSNKWEDGSNVNWTTVESNSQNCMVEIPKFYYCKKDIGGVWSFGVADTPIEVDGILLSDWEVHPAFFRDRLSLCDVTTGTATEVDFRYVGTFDGWVDGSGRLRSLPNKMPTASTTIANFRNHAKNNGIGWSQFDYYLLYAIQMLYITEYAHPDSQTKIGKGYTSTSAYSNTGATLINGNNTYGSSNATVHMSYRGIEDFYGNFYNWIDGLYSDGSSNILIGNKGYNNTGVGYTNVGSGGGSNLLYGYIKDIQSYKDAGFIIKTSGGSSSTRLYDYGYLSSGCLPRFGGGRSGGSVAGSFQLYVGYSESESYSSLAARLAY